MPSPASSYTLYNAEITFHRAERLPVADANTLSSDPYVDATIIVPSYSHERDDPPLQYRSPTVRRTLDPTWDAKWLVAGLPASGFELVVRVRDEDPASSDDKLGKAVAGFSRGNITEAMHVQERSYAVKKRRGNFKPWTLTYLASALPGRQLAKHNRVIVSVKILGKTEDQKDRRVYTIGPNKWSQHFSPTIGAIVNKAAGEKSKGEAKTAGNDTKLSSSSFIANKLQLTGPVPADLRHRYVGYRPFVKSLFSNSGIKGRILNRALHHQYMTIYGYDKSTVYGVVDATEEDPDKGTTGEGQPGADTASRALATQFLKMTEWGRGARLYTYVLTLDAEWRFTETGDEFAVDFLSKHSMHADVAKEIAFSGEFFVRRVGEKGGAGGVDISDKEDGHKGKDGEEKGKDGNEEAEDGKDEKKDDKEEEKAEHDEQKHDKSSAVDKALAEVKKQKAALATKEAELEKQASMLQDTMHGKERPDLHDAPAAQPPPRAGSGDAPPSADPHDYELVIDNDSGTYRPKKELLPQLEAWLADPRRLGALGKVTAMDGFDKTLEGWKEERKKAKAKLRESGAAEAPPRVAMVRRGTSVSSIESGRIGAGSVSSGEVEAVLKGEQQKDEGAVADGPGSSATPNGKEAGKGVADAPNGHANGNVQTV